MKQFIGMTSKAMYMYKFTNISIPNANTIKIYLVPTNVKCTAENIDISQLELVWTKVMNGENFETKYDSINYVDGAHGDDNFKLLANGECIHKSKYLQKYLIETAELFTLNVTNFVDH